MFDVAAQYQAVQRRDPALDGVVFIAVKTTGIYCRPVCRARTPLARNIEFYPSAAAAERAGYRPCLRCRPETAPFCPAWKGTRTTVERALALIEAGALDSNSVGALAEKLGIGPRHLSRLFVEHLDAPPLQVALSLRIQRAKRLLDDTDLAHRPDRRACRVFQLAANEGRIRAALRAVTFDAAQTADSSKQLCGGRCHVCVIQSGDEAYGKPYRQDLWDRRRRQTK